MMQEKQESSKKTFTSTNLFTQRPKTGLSLINKWSITNGECITYILLSSHGKIVKILVNKNITADMNSQKLLQVTKDTASLVTQDKMWRHLLSYRCSTTTV
jgi:hypothetical protein